MFDLKKIKNAIASLGNEQKKLTNEIEAKKQERETLQALPRSKEDLAATVDAWLVGQRDVFLARLKQNVSYLIASPDTVLQPGDDLSIFTAKDMFGTPVPRDGNLLGLMAPMIRESLKDAILELPDYPEETGPAYPLRVKEITKLDKSIGDLETKISDLKTSAASAGIQLTPETEPLQPDFSGGEPIHPEARQAAFEKANKS